jgi:hypothetical protein
VQSGQLYLCYLLRITTDMSRYLLKRRGFLASAGLALALLLVGAARVRAQSGNGTVIGTVRASTGIGLPGATVTARHSPSGRERSTITQADGSYAFDDLPAGSGYEIQAALSGFALVLHANVTVVPSQRVTVDFTLYAATSEALVVTGRIATLGQERSTVQQLVNETLTHALPLVGRDFLALSSLTAGFTGNSVAPSPLGQIYWTNNVVVDGASHYSKWRGAPRAFSSGYSLESIREVQVLTSQFSAEYGEALAAVTVAVTNSGTNTLHGSAFLFAQDEALNDLPVFVPRKPPFSSQRLGMAAGGPIRKDRTHFFGSYQGLRSRGSNIVTSPAASGALARDDEDEHLAFFKVDHKSTQRDLISVRYNGQWFRWHNEPGAYTLPGTGTHYTNDVHTLLVTDTALISSRLLNQLRFQFSRYRDVRRDLQPTVYIRRFGYSIEGGLLGPLGFGVNPEDTWEGADTLSYRRGKHGYRIGAGMKYVRAHNESLPAGRGAYFFAPGAALPFAFQQSLGDLAAATADPRSLSAFGFVQDDWTLASRLTLNYGLRYDVEGLSNVRHFNAATDKNNLQPRLGLAWQVAPSRTTVRGGIGMYTQQHLLGHITRLELEGADDTDILKLDRENNPALMPVFPNVFPQTLASRPPRDIVILDPAFRNPHSVQATVGVEHSMFGLTFDADFVYLRGVGLLSLVDTNAPASIRKPFVRPRSVTEADATRPITPVTNGFREIVALGNEGKSSYRAMQIKVNRSAGPVVGMVAYTLAKAEDQALLVRTLGASDKYWREEYLLPEDSRNLDAEKGPADNDVRHNLSIGLTWQVPGGRRGLNGLALSGIGVFRSSRPYTIMWGDDRNGTTQNDARPGDRNSARGDTYQTIDLALTKQFRTHGKSVEARVEAFNILSATNYDEYDGVLLSPSFAKPVSAFPRRRVQLAAVVKF